MPKSQSAAREPVSREALGAICRFDTCTIANAIEQFGVRLRNEGFTQPGLRAITGGFPRVIGYAATCRVRSSDPPMIGNSYLDRTDWWGPILALPEPRIAVVEDLDCCAGSGSVAGEVHAAILKAFGCKGLITNGAVRDIPAVSRMDFPFFATALTVSHAYTHVVEYGTPIHIFGLEIRPGDLLYADCHGAVAIPPDIAEDIPGAASAIRAKERRIVDVCQSPDFSPEKLFEVIKESR